MMDMVDDAPDFVALLGVASAAPPEPPVVPLAAPAIAVDDVTPTWGSGFLGLVPSQICSTYLH